MNHQYNPNQNNGDNYRQPYHPPLPPPRAGQVAAAGLGSAIPSPTKGAIAMIHTTTQPQLSSAADIVAAATQGPISAAARVPQAAAFSAAATAAATAVFVPNTNTAKHRYKKRTKKYNNFNIFFMLERQLLLQSRGGGINAIETPIDTSDSPMTKHKELHLPPLCHRYNHLPLTSKWFLELLANRDKKRPHRKSHGLIPFKELAQEIAKNYREIDDETQSFVNEVAERLGWHCEEMGAFEEQERKEERQLDLQGVASRSNSVLMDGDDRLYEMASRAANMTGSSDVGLSVFGASVYARKKRKDPPVVSEAGRGAKAAFRPALSHDEAATVQQLVGMTSRSPPRGHPVDTEYDRLQLELAHAMVNSRLESEIQLLKEQMTMHHASRAAHSQPSAHDHQVTEAAQHRPCGQVAHPQAAHIGWQQGQHPSTAAHPRSVCSHLVHPQERQAQTNISPSIMRNLPVGYEQYLTMLGYHEDFGSTMNDLRDHSLQSNWAAMVSNVNVDGGAPFKKRARYSENFEDAAEKARDEENRAKESMEMAYLPQTTRKAASVVPGIPSDIGFYKDLYSNLATSTMMTAASARDAAAKRDYPLAETDAAASDEHRDLALMDRLLARGSNEHAATQHALLDSLARGHCGPRDAYHHYPPTQRAVAQYPPPLHRGTSFAAAGLHNHSYAALRQHEEERVLARLHLLY